MKKITLLLFLLTISLGFAQQQQYLFDFEPGTPSGAATNWFTFDNGSPAAEIVTNPDPDGVNTSATTKVMKCVMGPENAFYAGVNNRWQDRAFGTWKIDAAVSSNLIISMDINKNYVGTVGIKMATNTGGTPFQITDQNVSNNAVNEWVTLTWTIPAIPPTLETNIAQFVVFVDWRTNDAGSLLRAPGSTIYIDNIRFNAQKLTDPPVPTCTDGILNGTETGVDCGGSCPACILDPMVSAPAPIIPESEVLSVYSDTYLTNKVTGFVFQDFTGNGPNSQIDIESNGNQTAKLTNLTFYGPRFDSVNLTEEISAGVPKYNYVHFNYYATTTNKIEFFVIDPQAPCCGSVNEPRYTINNTGGNEVLVRGQWKSVFIPLSVFSNYPVGGASWNGTPVTQIKFEGNGTMYYDNVFFSRNNVLSSTDFETLNLALYPNPSTNVLNIESTSMIEKVSVYNLLGQEVISQTPNTELVTLDVASLQVGVYVVKTSIGGNITSTRFIKE